MNKKLLIGLIASALVFAFIATGALYGVLPNLTNVADTTVTGSVAQNTIENNNSDLENFAGSSSSKHEHTLVIDVDVLPTCTSTGLTLGQHCLTCGAVIVKQEVVPMLPHTDANGDSRCDVCGNDVVDPCEHKVKEILPAVAPTCTATGLTEGERCVICHAVTITQHPVNTLPHNPGNWIIDMQPTKTEDGEKHRDCIVCGALVEKETLPATGSIGLLYTLNSDSNSYKVSIGTATDTEIVILANYKGLPVTKVADYGFANCDDIVSVLIPDTITTIGDYAFDNCLSLVDAVLPANVTTIGNYAFGHCASLEEMVIPSKVKTIGDYAFRYCTSLKEMNIPDSVTLIGDYAFRYCVALEELTIGKGVKTIGDYAFYNCTSLTEVEIPANVEKIEWAVFAECSSLTNILVNDNNKNYTDINGNLYTFDGKKLMQYAIGKSDATFAIPNGVTYVDDYAFRGCTSLLNVTIPNSVNKIGAGAFYNCSSLVSVDIPNSVTEIGHSVFRNCSSLVSVVLPDSIKSIGDSSFYKCYSLTDITIPTRVTSIGESAFYMCRSLTSIEIPNSIKTIGEKAFYQCISLESAKIGSGITKLENHTFYGCTSLVTVELPATIKSIGEYVFADCTALNNITYPGTVHNWMSVAKGSYWNYNIADEDVVCSDGKTSK